MTLRYSAPMPENLRHFMRARQHPARAVDCPHCGVPAHRPCVLRKSGRILTEPHPQRVSAWAQTTACCPQCQVEPTTPCHDEGRARITVHERREEEARVTAA
ncbi:hypothetical protein FPZ41_00935 [Streptomyces sp. K1PN6]|uniref:DNA-binding phage zinc finger domain-containing protein n=1 Tax=Streptomyces acidicola TaxID=2596892 RepID=A0A5N8WK60_9ACTN|nr:hypothetical protein [Streptomyces acidicola]MPY47226.1 hypothetical protein [Streptomyces acidicola]